MTVRELFDSDIDFSWNYRIVLYYEKFPARYIAYEVPEFFQGCQKMISQTCKNKFITYLDFPIGSIWAQQGTDGASELVISLL